MMDISDYLNGLKALADDAVAVNLNDYEKDGLLYCCYCHTPKQTIIDIGGRPTKVMCLCSCAQAARAAADAAVEAEQERIRINQMRSAGFPDRQMERWTFDKAADCKAVDIARRYVDNFQKMKAMSKGILFFGDVGTGKSFAAACIVNAVISRGVSAMMTNFPRLINMLEANRFEAQSYIDSLDRYTLLCIDDLGVESTSAYIQSKVFEIIDARYRSGKPLIVTTNMTSDQIKAPGDISRERICSRLREMCLPIEVKGSDRRNSKLIKDFAEVKDLLGLGE